MLSRQCGRNSAEACARELCEAGGYAAWFDKSVAVKYKTEEPKALLYQYSSKPSTLWLLTVLCPAQCAL